MTIPLDPTAFAMQRRRGPTTAHTRRFAELARGAAGLNLKPEKIEFFDQRLSRRLNYLGLQGYDDYVALLEGPQGVTELPWMVEALTTHTTNFFREAQHYQFLKDVGFGALAEQGAGQERDLTIWSAACSTGAELYSALITANEYKDETRRTLRLAGVGTDISRQILKRAADAVYGPSEIMELSEARRRRFLLRDRHGEPRFRIEPALRRLCRWRLFNLTEPGDVEPPKADVIFVRNVLIYFDNETQAQVIRRLVGSMTAGGYLLTGHSESIGSPPDGLVTIGPSIYRKQR